MREQLKIRVDGVDETLQMLRNVKKSTGRKILRKAVNEGIKPIYQEIRANVPRDTGKLRKGIKKSSRIRRDGTAIGRVIAGKGARHQVPVEEGHMARGRKTWVEGRPVIRLAVKSKSLLAEERMKKTIIDGINQAKQ